MTSPIRPLNFVEHGKVKISTKRNYPHVKTQQVVPLIVHEFTKAAAEMPVVFVKNAETGEFQPVAILGFEQGENLFYSENSWHSPYLPAVIKHHPFALVPMEGEENQLQVVIIESEHVLAETEGELLFNADGKETEYLTKRKQAIGNYYENMDVTKKFVNYLNEKELLNEQSLTIDLNGEKRQLSGLYLVDEKKLNELPESEFLDLRKRGFLPAIYAHMLSLQQLNRLAELKTRHA